MTPEPTDTPLNTDPEQSEAAPEAETSPVDAAQSEVTQVKAPRRRAPKLDALLAEATEAAREALAELAEDGQIGEHRGTTADDDRLVTHRFAAELAGYRGWEWFATLARAPRSRQITVCEIGLLPGAEAIVAPDWVPWSDRVSAEEKARLDAIAAGEDPEKALRQLQAAEEPEDQSEEPGTPAEDEAAAEDDDSQGPTAQEPSDQSSSASQD
ncbi:DUF3027 domain-containing protein [Micrococcus sp. IITD107]|uniref:DUF3027 domain-containing protein n=1 Tax=Micrococcus sp. IITD107 TaxID=3342790 RepID=UPI0035B9F955